MQGHIELPQSINHPFDLAKTLDGSQDFRWHPLDDGWHSGVLDGNLVHLRQNVDTLEYRAHTNLDTLLTSYFRLNEDLDVVYSTLSALDPYIATLANEYPHLRLLRQPDPWECTVSYICSARNRVGGISKIVEKIAQNLGEKLELDGKVRHTFPTPERVLEAGPECLQAMYLGLRRDEYIFQAAQRVYEGQLDLKRLADSDIPYEEAKNELMKCQGIREKISDCIALFSLNKQQAFPVDTHIRSAALAGYFHLGDRATNERLAEWAQAYFGKYAGWAGQLLFQSIWAHPRPKHRSPGPRLQEVKKLPYDKSPQIRLSIDKRGVFAEGLEFGDTGAYEKIVGRVSFAVNPDSPAYSSVVDIQYAPRNPEGLVEFSTDFFILKPIDMSRGNRRLVYDVNNRGTKLLVHFLNDAPLTDNPSTPEHAGNGFLMRRGYTVLWSGWQGDILPGENLMSMDLPVASMNGVPITGPVRAEFSPGDEITKLGSEAAARCMPLSGNAYTKSYPTAFLDTSNAVFTYREYETDPRISIPPDAWQFAKLDSSGKVVPSSTDVYLPQGFKPGWIYELVYAAKDPLVMGLGFTGVRDLISFLINADTDSEGAPNPVRDNDAVIEKAYGWGCSQSARFLREFVYRGFNEDTQGRQVFAGISPFVSGGGRVFVNYRFSQPGRYPRQHYDHLYPSDQFPHAYPVTTDPLRGRTDGILKRPPTDPLVIHTQSASEYWQRRGSLVHTDSLGNDLPDHERSRVYLFASAEHSPDHVNGPIYDQFKHPSNPLNVTALLRAMIDNLDGWATDGIPPPDSRVPSREAETCVPAEVSNSRFPAIPGVQAPSTPNRLFVQDHGPNFDQGVLSVEPPIEDKGKEYTVLVPHVDADGNDIPGIRGPELEVPLATYTGWNFRPQGAAEKAMAAVNGSYLPFAKTRAERLKKGDPRPSIEERYGSRARYVKLVALASQRLVEERLILEEDADRFVKWAMLEPAFDEIG